MRPPTPGLRGPGTPGGAASVLGADPALGDDRDGDPIAMLAAAAGLRSAGMVGLAALV